MAAADEADPLAHPDALRRRRTLRDAALAAKATGRNLGGGGGAGGGAPGSGGLGGTGSGGGGGGDVEAPPPAPAPAPAPAPWIGRRVIGIGGRTQVVAPEAMTPDHSTARLSIGSR